MPPPTLFDRTLQAAAIDRHTDPTPLQLIRIITLST
jgi:hypothetical protein